jgi:shikimate kinase
MVILIGLRGSGKTTIGRLLAARLGVGLCDLDDVTVRVLGATSVAEAWRTRGEKAFREAEVKALAEALSTQSGVLALGGGTPMVAGALELIHSAQAAGGQVVYLRATAPTLRARLEGKTGDRPSLTGADPLVEIDAVLAKRDPIYLKLADVVIDVDGSDQAAVTDQVRRALDSGS